MILNTVTGGGGAGGSDEKNPTYGSHIWGFTITQDTDNPNTRVVYTDDAIGMKPMSKSGTSVDPGDWVGTSILEDIHPCIIHKNDDGTMSKWYLDRKDITKYEDGEEAPRMRGYDYMVEFMKKGVKVETTGANSLQLTTITVKFTDMPQDIGEQAGFSYWNFQYDGVVEDAFYMGMFLGECDGTGAWSNIGSTPTGNVSRDDWIARCKSRGEGFDIQMWNKRDYISALLILLSKSTDGQSVFGSGYVGSNSSIKKSDPIVYENNYGMYSGSSTSRMSFLWINDYWGNITQLLGGLGIQYDSSRGWYDVKSSDVSDYTVGEKIQSFSRLDYNGTCKYVAGNVKGITFPTATTTSSSAGYCDSMVIDNTLVTMGGFYDYTAAKAGPFCLITYKNTGSYIGSRLSYNKAIGFNE